MNVRVSERVVERLIYDLRKIENFKKIREMPGIDGKYRAGHQKSKF